MPRKIDSYGAPRKASPQMNMLTGREFRRMIARFGGLFTLGEFAEICDCPTKHWPKGKHFPEPGWEANGVRLYSGWEVFQWLWERKKLTEAGRLKSEIESLKRRKFR